MFQLPRYVPPEGVTIAGSFIPGGYAVSISPRSHNRLKEIFGEDADEWRPERWLEDESKSKYMDYLLTTVSQRP
jgi:cytochrome P450